MTKNSLEANLLLKEVHELRSALSEAKEGFGRTAAHYTSSDWKTIRSFRKSIQVNLRRLFELGYKYNTRTQKIIKIPTSTGKK